MWGDRVPAGFRGLKNSLTADGSSGMIHRSCGNPPREPNKLATRKARLEQWREPARERREYEWQRNVSSISSGSNPSSGCDPTTVAASAEERADISGFLVSAGSACASSLIREFFPESKNRAGSSGGHRCIAILLP